MVKNPPANAGNLGSIPELGRSPGKRNGNPPQYSCLQNPMDSGSWRATVHGVAKSWTQLSLHTHIHTILCCVDVQQKHGGWEGRLISSSHPSRPALASEPSFTLHP